MLRKSLVMMPTPRRTPGNTVAATGQSDKMQMLREFWTGQNGCSVSSALLLIC